METLKKALLRTMLDALSAFLSSLAFALYSLKMLAQTSTVNAFAASLVLLTASASFAVLFVFMRTRMRSWAVRRKIVIPSAPREGSESPSEAETVPIDDDQTASLLEPYAMSWRELEAQANSSVRTESFGSFRHWSDARFGSAQTSFMEQGV